MAASERKGMTASGGVLVDVTAPYTVNFYDPAHRCTDVVVAVTAALNVSMSRNIMLDGVAMGMLEELGKAGWCIIRAEDL